MALDSFDNLRRSLCGGCLSSDRKLSETNYEYKHLFGELVGSTVSVFFNVTLIIWIN